MEYKQLSFVYWSALLVLCAFGATSVEAQCTSGFSPVDNFQTDENGLQYIEPQTNNTNGAQVIVPQMRFNCHGFITGWSALTVLPTSDIGVLQNIPHEIEFQVWRPKGGDNDGGYTLVGSNTITLSGLTLEDGPTPMDLNNASTGYFRFGFDQGAVREIENRISFQPGDVVGWFTAAFLQTVTFPLSVVYRDATSEDDSSLIVDMYSSLTPNTRCDLSTCAEKVNHRSSVIPYVAVEYSPLGSSTTNTPTVNPRACVPTTIASCASSTVTQPTVATEPTAPTPQTTDSPITRTTSSITLPLIVGGSLVAVLIIIIVVVGILVIWLALKKNRTNSHNITKKYNENPTYATPDTPPSLVETDFGMHYQASNGALYALPHSTRSQSVDSQAALLNPPNIFDGECYASTYHTNGQMHVYQELEKHLPDHRSGSVPTRNLFQSERGHKRGPIPRFSTSSISHFPYTMPSTPAPSYPYLEAIGSRPRPPAIPLPQTPDDTPPSSASVSSSTGPPVRKLFIGLDDDGFHVPSADDRVQFFDSDPNEIYSRLNRNHTKSRDSRDVTFFEQSNFYWEPPSSTNELYNQLSQRKYREIHRDYIHITDSLGYRHFGTVHKGVWDVPGGKVNVAVKTLKPDSPEEARVMFLREAAIMGQFLHPNVVKLQGVVTVGEPLMIVLELMPRGDLKQYLREFKNETTPIPSNLPSTFINFCRQIAFGMNYLSNKAFIHRDLATRNILLTEDLICKIGDFGMARDLAEDTVYHSQGGKIPIKWTAPEALNYRKFTAASDVWSYGMVLFEIWSLGRKPYERVTNSKMMELINSGHCQSPPPGCPRAIYQLMIQCWHFVPAKRPKFSEICDYLNSSNELLLNWSNDDRGVSERVMELGAPLTEAKFLYPDLQCTYNNDYTSDV